jgi:hypothetical protein
MKTSLNHLAKLVTATSAATGASQLLVEGRVIRVVGTPWIASHIWKKVECPEVKLFSCHLPSGAASAL